MLAKTMREVATGVFYNKAFADLTEEIGEQAKAGKFSFTVNLTTHFGLSYTESKFKEWAVNNGFTILERDGGEGIIYW